MNHSAHDPDQARAALDDATARSHSAANRLPENAFWFEIVWLAYIGGLVLSMLLAWPFNVLVVFALLFGLVKAIGIYQERYGVWVSGFYPGRTRTIAIALSVVLLTILFAVWSLRQVHGLIWPGFAGAALAMTISFVAGRAWMRAYRQESTKP